MKTPTIQELLEAGATKLEAESAVELWRILRPSLKVKRNGRVETTHGDKNPLGLYRTVSDLARHVNRLTPDKFTRVTRDSNGNSRHVVWYNWLLPESAKHHAAREDHFSIALCIAHKIGGKRYRGADFGGIVFQATQGELPELIEVIEKAKADFEVAK